MRQLRAPLFLFLIALACSADSANELGRIDFPTSGSPEAHAHFLRGALLLHSFEYSDAREAFRKAREIEPGFAMAAWGEAMTRNHPLWLQEDLDSARAALEQLAPTPEERRALAPTEREKGYLRAVEILFGEGDKKQRDDAYRDAMSELAERFPEDLDAAAFHALAILGTCHEGRDTATYMRAASVVEEVFDRNPEHPGAAHYLIHSYDDPVHAPLGLRPARLYAGIAPAAVHALHMPSHIFLALGLWPETASSNEDSWQASLAKVERQGLGVDSKSFHALWWLEYAYLQQGRYHDARRLLSIMEQDATASPSGRTGRHLAYMRAHYLFETERWGEEIAAPDLDDLGIKAAATLLFTDGMSALENDDPELAEKRLAELRRRRQDVLAEATEGPAGGTLRAGSIRTLEAQVMELELSGMISLAGGRIDEALEKLADATRLEEDAAVGFGPPVPPKPSFELLGEVLLELGKPAEALPVLERALARSPRRVLALRALGQAAAAVGDRQAATRIAATLREIRRRADAHQSK